MLKQFLYFILGALVSIMLAFYGVQIFWEGIWWVMAVVALVAVIDLIPNEDEGS